MKSELQTGNGKNHGCAPTTVAADVRRRTAQSNGTNRDGIFRRFKATTDGILICGRPESAGTSALSFVPPGKPAGHEFPATTNANADVRKSRAPQRRSMWPAFLGHGEGTLPASGAVPMDARERGSGIVGKGMEAKE
ncbi:hypothetical protein LBMAG56_29240 [Verrucomicrobiota bacterium]|nr:hypothetical protein LBMAG56_29240 [Verrucomicrobiota bacterium]